MKQWEEAARNGSGIERLEEMLAGRLPLPESIDTHIRQRQLDLAASVSQRTPVYLDSRFWIDLQRAETDDVGTASRAYPLLMALREAVKGGKAFCPISTSTFVEMLKHGDREVRVASAKLVDELSLGITLLPLDELLRAEVRWFVDHPGDHPLDPLAEPVWTRLAYSLGTPVAELQGIPAREQLAFQAVAFDEIWEMTLEEIAMTADPMRPDFNAAAARITEDSAAHSHEIPTFDDAYKSELAPMGELGAAFFVEKVSDLAKEAGQQANMGPAEIALCRNVVRNSLALGKARQALRSGHIRASLHAIIRHNKGRRFKPNDIFDIEHAVCGVGYCRAFFTEGSLGTATRQPPLKLDRLYGCLVTNDFEEATRFVRGLS